MTRRMLALLGVNFCLATSGALAAPNCDSQPPIAFDHHPPVPEESDVPLPPFLRGVSLTEAQRDKIFELTYAQIPTLRARSRELRQTHEALMRMTLSGQYDEGKAKKLTETTGRALSDIALLRARTDAAIIELLTQEQRDVVKANDPGKMGQGPGRQAPPTER